MKRCYLIACLCICFNLTFGQEQALLSQAEGPRIIKSFESPTHSNMDLAFDGKYLWEVSAAGYIFKISTEDGHLIKKIEIDTDYGAGLAFDGEHLWYSDRHQHKLVQIDTARGEILKEFDMGKRPLGGLSWVNSVLWLNSNQENSGVGDTTFQVSAVTGEIISYFLPFGEQPTGLASDGISVWTSDNKKDMIYRLDINTRAVIDSLKAPGGEYPNGLAFDGRYIWSSNNQEDSIYQIDFGYSLLSSTVNPAVMEQISVYPNPSAGEFIFEQPSEANQQILDIRVFNATGSTLSQTQMDPFGRAMIDLSNYSAGVYYYSIISEGQLLQTGKLVKQ
ncbi:MAG: T9SS type A sorting domain-containing protein [Bacteroidota bacterium]